MTIKNVLLFGLAGCIYFASPWSAAAQELAPSTTRGTAKVQIRYFNPFDVGSSRLTMDPFGFFTVQRASVSPFSMTGSSAVGSSAAATSNTSSDSSTAAAPTGLATSAEVLDPGAQTIAVGAARPPFRPPVRSPFRPPPRPPF
jgi:hypothetical protein